MKEKKKSTGHKAMVGHPKAQATGIKSWPLDDRPREKLLKKGAGTLSNSELLAILLRTGTKGTSAIDLSRNILKKFGTFRDMAHTDTRDWKEFKGLGGAKIAHIQAALEIGRRYQQDVVSPGKQNKSSGPVLASRRNYSRAMTRSSLRIF